MNQPTDDWRLQRLVDEWKTKHEYQLIADHRFDKLEYPRTFFWKILRYNKANPK